MDKYLTMKCVKFSNIFYSIYQINRYNEDKEIFFQADNYFIKSEIYKEEKHEKV